MSDDWKPGDLALCVREVRCPCCGTWPVTRGQTYTVEGTLIVRGDLGLILAGKSPPHGDGFRAEYFTKIHPTPKTKKIARRSACLRARPNTSPPPNHHEGE